MNITAYLKDIDLEAEHLRNEIFKLQVRLQQLADARSLMMTREEERAHRLGEASPFGVFPNGASLAFRDPVAYQPQGRMTPEQVLGHQGAPQLAAPPDAVDKAERKRQRDHKNYELRKVRQRAQRSDAGVPRATKSSRENGFREKIREVLADGQPRNIPEIMHAISPHRILEKNEKQSIYNALSYMKLSTGELHQSQFGEPYTLIKQHEPVPAQ